ncbi:hypothetical protein AYO22_07760 [Fonsecaea multimorphosa]|nr:hypothetical protein AYO22_07760 [Fonsecaea multimorphosa]
MELQRSLPRPANLRRSYIEISRYIRTRVTQTGFSSTPPSTTRACLSPRLTYSTSAIRRERRPDKLSQVANPDIRRFDYSRISSSSTASTAWERLRQTDVDSLSTAPDPDDGERTRVQLYGYITSHRPGRGFDFIQLVDPRLELAVQVIFPHHDSTAKVAESTSVENRLGAEELSADRRSGYEGPFEEEQSIFRSARPHTPIRISGRVVRRLIPPKKDHTQAASGVCDTKRLDNTIPTLDPYVGDINLISHVEIRAESCKLLNGVPPDLTAKRDTVLPPELRYLQFRTDSDLRRRIRLRSQLAGKIREHMLRNDFDEIETPLLFKSTPEGAREFIVPTRKKGFAYALPQSPQQYKQVLMASGISRYFQFAKCFRDEDLRADRQPEFTQLDLEMAFTTSADVMAVVEGLLIHAVWPNVPGIAPLQPSAPAMSLEAASADPVYRNLAFPQLTYNIAMSRYGSDKPDTRLGSEIRRVDDWLSPNVKSMVTSRQDDTIMEMMKISMQGCEPADSQKFVTAFLEASSKAKARYTKDKNRIPGVAVFDPLKPLHGLASFDHEGAAKVEEEFDPEPGDILILYSREDKPFTGGSTVLGDLRRDIYQHAISEGLIAAPSGFSALWITDFPLFSPTEESEPGQGGSAGICSTHHPFTAPKQGQDLKVSTFKEDPLSIIGDHYDLVINGVEVGGGSCRIHREFMQEFILEEVLKLKPARVKDFGHLLRALRAGCPPHAGFALGFDRLMAMLTNSASVRDVIAFPKYADGEDKFAGAPSPISRHQLATYHLVAVDDKVPRGSSAKTSRKA